MKTVMILKNWEKPNLHRQTPGGLGSWAGIKFTFDLVSECEYVIVLNYSPVKLTVNTYKENIWSVQQEPPNEQFKNWHQTDRVYYRVFTTDSDLDDDRYVQYQPALPWLINRSYDELINCSSSSKLLKASWITSHKDFTAGHRKRMNLFERIRTEKKKGATDVDLIATEEYFLENNKKNKESKNRIRQQLLQSGYTKIVKDKWESLSPYRYSLVVENFQGPDYWSEKLADCFLTWTMPIYYGCTNINDYFPRNSLVQIDIEDPDVMEKIQRIINSSLWIDNKKEIAYARRLILDKYQFFPHFTDEINRWDKRMKGKKRQKQKITIPKGNTLAEQLRSYYKKLANFLK